jgi:hypothetical protein
VKAGIGRGLVAVGVLATMALGMGPAKAQGSTLDISLCSPKDHMFTHQHINNQFFPLTGVNWTLVGPTTDGTHGLLITDSNQQSPRSFTQPGWGSPVDTEVIEEKEWLDNGDGVFDPNSEKLVEISRNFYAQTVTGSQPGTVCYFGEEVDIYDGQGNTPDHILPDPQGHLGSWSVADPNNEPGIFMPAAPKPGQHYFEESAAPIALDQATITGVGSVSVPLPPGTFANAIRVKEFSSLEKRSKEYKSYAPNGVGLLVDDTLQRCAPGANCLGTALRSR